MAALIKNALIKQLSKFLKNVSANQINISTLKGEGEMKNIQLDENVLMELLEFPTWLRITNARCNKASLKIQWTKLKTNPIMISLDKIELDVEIADPLRDLTTSKDSKLFDKDFGGSYGFIDKCIDAIQLNIDSVTVTIKSNKFNASLNMSNIYVYSVTPTWMIASDIRMTRIKDLERGEIIVFKEISWEICRLEAYNIDTQLQSQQATSIKLIMNPSKVQIALKKKLSDKSMICSTFRVLLNEIYWMANDTQVKAAIGTYTTISKLMKKSFAQKRKYAKFDQQQQQQQPLQQKTSRFQTQSSANNQTNIQSPPPDVDVSKVFRQFDIKETSLHLCVSILNIHVYADDNYSGNKQIDGGAMQLLFKNLCIDHYPYHRFGSSVKHWNNYNPTFRQRDDWSRGLFVEFIGKLEKILNKTMIDDLGRIKLKNTANLLEACTVFTLKDFCMYKVTTNLSNKAASGSGLRAKKTSAQTPVHEESAVAAAATATANTTTPNDMIKSENYFIDQQMFNKKTFISSNYAEFNLPPESLFAQCFFSEFYLPEDANYPIPSAQIFIQVAPVLVNIDFLTLLWINTLMFSLYREKQIVDEKISKKEKKASLGLPIDSSSRFNLHVDTYLEVLLPKVSLTVYPSDMKMYQGVNGFVNRPSGVELGFSRILLTNQNLTHTACPEKVDALRRTSEKCAVIAKDLVNRNATKISKVTESACHEIEFNVLAPCFIDLVQNENLPYVRYDFSTNHEQLKVNTTNEAHNSTTGLFLKSLNKNSLNKASTKDVWLIELDSAWVDFLGFVDDQNSTLIRNMSFRLWMVNVWDFYNCYTFLNSTSVEKVDEIDRQENEEKMNQTYKKLANIIQIGNDSAETSRMLCKPKSNNEKRAVLKMKRSSSLTVATNLINNKKKSDFLCKKIYSKLNVITEINEVHVCVNHSKVLFLLRLIDIVDLFSQQLKQDTEQTLKYKHNSDLSILGNEPYVSLSEKNKINNTGSGRPRLQRVNSTNLEDWFINGILKTEPEFSIGGPDENQVFSVNLAILINSVEVDLSINDLTKEQFGPAAALASVSQSYSNTENLLTVQAPSDADSISKKSLLFDDIDNNKLTSHRGGGGGIDASDNLSRKSFELSSDKHYQQQTQHTHVECQDEFDIVYRPLDRDFMFSYIKYVYGLSTDNPNTNYQHIPSTSTVKPGLSVSISNLSGNSSSESSHQASLHRNHGNKIFSNSTEKEKDHRSESISSVSSSIKSHKNTFFGNISSSKNASTLISSLKTASIGSKSSSTKQIEEAEDFDDDNDNDNNILLELQQEDTISQTSMDISTPILLTSQFNESILSRPKSVNAAVSISSTGYSAANATSKATYSLSLSSNNTVSSDSLIQNQSATQISASQHAQTVQLTRNIKIKIDGVKIYAQTQNENVLALVKVDDLDIIQGNKNKPKDAEAKKSSLSSNEDILVRYKKSVDDFESKDGLVEVMLDEFKFDIDIATINGLVELIDDLSDNFIMTNPDLTPKDLLPLNVFLRNCRFRLRDEPNTPIENNPKLIDMTIEKLKLSRLPNNQLLIKESLIPNKSNEIGTFSKKAVKMQTNFTSSGSVLQNLESLVKFQNDFELDKRVGHMKSDKYASLVYMLRKSKEDNSQLRMQFEQEKTMHANEKSNLIMKLKLSHMQSEELKKTIKDLQAAKGDVQNGDFVLTDKNDTLLDQLKLERKQFECLLKQFEEENESLKAKLQKSEDHIVVLNIERQCLMKNINKNK